MSKQTFTTGQILTAAQMTTLQANDYNQTVSAKVASYTLVAADAGTRITMSNASPTTITVNTALFTAGDTLTITNIGAGACTITAGTATVSSSGSTILAQYDSGTLYFSSTSAAIWNGANPGDITGVTAGVGLTGGGTSGAVILNLATTAKGDLVAGTGASTAAALAVGNNGETLVADSAATTGLRYSATPSASNPVLNSAFQVWQRGTSVAVNGAAAGYVSDRWQIVTATASVNSTTSRQATGDTTNLPNIQYCARVQRNSGVTANGFISLQQYFETVNSIPFAGKAITLSFYARKGANFSDASSALGVQLQTGTGTDQNNGTGAYTGLATPINSTATLTTTWQRFSFNGTVASTATEIGLNLYFLSVGTAGTNDYFEITGVQIDIGSVALPFRTYAATIQGELAACQRYYFRYDPTASGTTIAYSRFGFGSANSTSQARIQIQNPTTMRTGPTTLDYNSNITAFDGVTTFAPSSMTIDTSSPMQTTLLFTPSSTSMTAFRPYWLYPNGNTAAYVGLSSEL